MTIRRNVIPLWLMRAECNCSSSLPKTAATLSGAAYRISTNPKGPGETMSIQTQAAVRETLRDFAMVSAFGFWAIVIGFVPVVAIHALIA